MLVATSIVMDVVSFAWSQAVSLHVSALKHSKISRVPLPNCRSRVIHVAIAGNPDGHLSPWQDAAAHQIIWDTQERLREGGNDWPRARALRDTVSGPRVRLNSGGPEVRLIWKSDHPVPMIRPNNQM
jgi:hypothetical protein